MVSLGETVKRKDERVNTLFWKREFFIVTIVGYKS